MVQELDTSGFFKGVKSEPAENNEKDMQVLQDLWDTMAYYRQKNKDEGYAMTANMIGANKRVIILFKSGNKIIINPVIIDSAEFLTPEEVEKVRIRTERNGRIGIFEDIALEYYDENWEKKRVLFKNEYGRLKELMDRLDGIF